MHANVPGYMTRFYSGIRDCFEKPVHHFTLHLVVDISLRPHLDIYLTANFM